MKSIIPLIAERKSEVAFSPVSLSSEDIKLLFEAARWAPSSYNEQPWRFYFARRESEKSFTKLINTLNPGNQEWAKNASILIISTAKKHVTRNGKENFYALHDTALAEANLLLQAQSMGFATHVMGGFDSEAVRNELAISNDFFPVAAIAVGYPGKIDELSPSLQQRTLSPRLRKALDEVVYELS